MCRSRKSTLSIQKSQRILWYILFGIISSLSFYISINSVSPKEKDRIRNRNRSSNLNTSDWNPDSLSSLERRRKILQTPSFGYAVWWKLILIGKKWLEHLLSWKLGDGRRCQYIYIQLIHYTPTQTHTRTHTTVGNYRERWSPVFSDYSHFFPILRIFWSISRRWVSGWSDEWRQGLLELRRCQVPNSIR